MEKRSIRMKHNMSDLLSFQLAKNIKQMSLQVTQQCNFRCAYCLYASKEFDVQRHHTSKRMSLETAIAAIDFFAAHSSAQQEICVGFYGGEPLLEFELIKRAIEYSEEVFEGKDLSFTMTSMAIYKNIPFVSTPYALIYGIWS